MRAWPVVLLAASCADERAPPAEVVPAGHPCAELAFTPDESMRWDGSEAPVPIALRLPTPVGLPVRVSQGNEGLFSHFGAERFAWDFEVELGTTVHAAAAGVVVWIEDTSTEYGPEADFRGKANFAVVDHGAGLFSAYVHLAAGSAEVAAGDVVRAGDVLATTGLSGQMTGPHLHFQVENVWSQSLPARFAAEDGGCALLPLQDETVVAWEVPLAEGHALSAMPADAFLENGVIGLGGMPARLLERADRPRIHGRATIAEATEVWFLVLPAAGGLAVYAQRFELEDGVFDGRLDAHEVAPGQYGVALVPGHGGAVTVPRSVRTALVE